MKTQRRKRFKTPSDFRRTKSAPSVVVGGRVAFESRAWLHKSGRVRVRALMSSYEDRTAWYVETLGDGGQWEPIGPPHRVKPAAFRSAAREARQLCRR